MNKLTVFGAIFLLSFLSIGALLAPPEIWLIAGYIWLSILAVIGLGVLAAIGLLIRWLWNKSQQSGLIYPDENGNLPVLLGRRGYQNLNLVGSEYDRAWLAWQMTNNRNGSPPREMFGGQMQPPMLEAPAVQIIDNEAEATPLMLEARTQVLEA